MAELDALTVITCRTNIYICIEYSILVAFRMFYATDMCLQADETPCTILYLIKGQKVDVGKDNEPLATHVPQLADPRWALQG